MKDGQAKPIKNEILEDQSQGEITVTIKNYNFDEGLSVKFHRMIADKVFEFKGPMGKGLDIHSKGVHVAFAAGTGVLVFIDLVAHLIRKNLKLMN